MLLIFVFIAVGGVGFFTLGQNENAVTTHPPVVRPLPEILYYTKVNQRWTYQGVGLISWSNIGGNASLDAYVVQGDVSQRLYTIEKRISRDSTHYGLSEVYSTIEGHITIRLSQEVVDIMFENTNDDTVSAASSLYSCAGNFSAYIPYTSRLMNVIISPDRQYVAVLIDTDIEDNVLIVDVTNGESHGHILTSVSSIEWVQGAVPELLVYRPNQSHQLVIMPHIDG